MLLRLAARRLTTAVPHAAAAARHQPRQPLQLARARAAPRWLSSKDEPPPDAEAAADAPDEAEPSDDAADAAEAEEGDPALAEAAEALLKATAERDDLKDQLIRAIAEQENTRRIARRDVKNAKDFAAQSFAKSLLDVSDSLGYAPTGADVKALTAAAADDADLGTLKEGVELTRTQLTKAFAANGVEFGEPDDAFDPALHEALFEMPDPEKAPGSVAQVVKTGFKLHDRVIRAAQVGVVKKA